MTLARVAENSKPRAAGVSAPPLSSARLLDTRLTKGDRKGSHLCMNGTAMALSPKHPASDDSVRQVAGPLSETVAGAVRITLREEPPHQRPLTREEDRELAHTLEAIAKRCAALSALDNRTEDAILGDEQNGLPS